MFKKIKFYKKLLVEIIETLCSICLYLDSQGRREHNSNAEHMRDHFTVLKGYSKELRKD